MNVVLWIFQITLMLMFMMDGVLKAFQYPIARANIPWVRDVPQGLVVFIGIIEIIAAFGLVLPIIFESLTMIAQIAASVLVILMLFNIFFHFKRKEYKDVKVSCIFLVIALFIMVGRIFF